MLEYSIRYYTIVIQHILMFSMLFSIFPYRTMERRPNGLFSANTVSTPCLVSAAQQLQVIEGINVTADSFYSSQGRADPAFDDEHLCFSHHST